MNSSNKTQVSGKEVVGRAFAEIVEDGMCLGVGSGSTVEIAVKVLGDRVRQEGLSLSCIATSPRSSMMADSAGLVVLSSFADVSLDIAFDGADEVDEACNLIKGGGAALLQEKIVAQRAGRNLIVLATEDKLVKQLGSKFPIPIEIIPSACQFIQKQLSVLGAKDMSLREASGKYGPLTTDNGNFILDIKLADVSAELEKEIISIPGIVETGLFYGYTKELLIASTDGKLLRKIP